MTFKEKNRCKKNEHTTFGYSIEGNVRQGRGEAVQARTMTELSEKKNKTKQKKRKTW